MSYQMLQRKQGWRGDGHDRYSCKYAVAQTRQYTDLVCLRCEHGANRAEAKLVSLGCQVDDTPSPQIWSLLLCNGVTK
jgi:hypothetical protein